MTIQAAVLSKGVHYNDDGDLVIPVVGVPFTGVTENGTGDLVKDVFTPETDTGPLNEVIAFWDHGREKEYLAGELKSLGYNDLQIKSMIDSGLGFGKQHIGVAKRAEMTEEGIIWNVIVSRRHKYLRLLEQAALAGLIGASSGAKLREPETPGVIKYYPIVEMTLTPMSMNPEAIVLLAKSLLSEGTMEEQSKAVVTEQQPATPASEAQAVATPIADAVRAVATEKAAGEKPEAETPSLADVVAAVVEKALAPLMQRIEGVETRVGGVEKSVGAFTDDMKIALPELAKQISEVVVTAVTGAPRKSAAELLAEKSVTSAAAAKPQGVTVKNETKNWPGAN